MASNCLAQRWDQGQAPASPKGANSQVTAVNPNIIQVLKDRGLFDAVTDPQLEELAQRESLTVYVGFDPSAPSLHIGNLVAIMGLKHFQLAGHRPIAVAGGGTGMIGDPSGKRTERTMLSVEAVRENTRRIGEQLARFLDFTGPCAARVLNNWDWLGAMSFVEFLRDVGKHFRISDMLEKESVRARLQSEVGISFTEFSYMLLQAYDFAWLYGHENCRVQCGGSDQWGNITAGTDLIHKSLRGKAYGVTFPLLLTSSGQKFGKSEGNSVWLDPGMTTPYDFYQYWMRTEDADVGRFLRLFTVLSGGEIDEIVRGHAGAPERREGQRRLAREITTMVHGAEEARRAEEASAALFRGGDDSAVDFARVVREAREGTGAGGPWGQVPVVRIPRAEWSGGAMSVARLFVRAGLAASNAEARRLIQQGGAYVNTSRVEDPNASLPAGEPEGYLLRAGKKKHAIALIE